MHSLIQTLSPFDRIIVLLDPQPAAAVRCYTFVLIGLMFRGHRLSLAGRRLLRRPPPPIAISPMTDEHIQQLADDMHAYYRSIGFVITEEGRTCAVILPNRNRFDSDETRASED